MQKKQRDAGKKKKKPQQTVNKGQLPQLDKEYLQKAYR